MSGPFRTSQFPLDTSNCRSELIRHQASNDFVTHSTQPNPLVVFTSEFKMLVTFSTYGGAVMLTAFPNQNNHNSISNSNLNNFSKAPSLGIQPRRTRYPPMEKRNNIDQQQEMSYSQGMYNPNAGQFGLEGFLNINMNATSPTQTSSIDMVDRRGYRVHKMGQSPRGRQLISAQLNMKKQIQENLEAFQAQRSLLEGNDAEHARPLVYHNASTPTHRSIYHSQSAHTPQQSSFNVSDGSIDPQLLTLSLPQSHRESAMRDIHYRQAMRNT